MNSPSYVSSMFGYGNAISVTSSSSQYVRINTRQILLSSTSFTIEGWIYPFSITSSDFGIFGQCQSFSVSYCLHFTLRGVALYCGFYGNDVAGATVLTMYRWSHVACSYDLSTGLQRVWLNGVIDGSRTTTPYLGSSVPSDIGVIYGNIPGSSAYFNGYIDQMKYNQRAKTSDEMLFSATVMGYYRLDSGSLLDAGPNGINLTLSGSATTITGRVNTALEFSSGSFIYVSYTTAYFLGVSNYPFSISLWIRPTSYGSASIFHVGTSSWCVGFLTMTSSGNIMANSWNGGTVTVSGPVPTLNTWTHVGYTYSSNNGLRLYINGVLYGSSGAFSFSASGTLVQFYFASNVGNNWCSPFYGGNFNGGIDEIYMVSREFTAAEIASLANP